MKVVAFDRKKWLSMATYLAIWESDDMSAPQFILDIEWSRPTSDSPNPPSLVGPFDSRKEADEWAALNIPNGSWECAPLAYPYLRRP